jgi:ATP-dependent DNA helicase Rep
MNLSQLNKEQQLAVKYVDGPLLVLAGAGSGKTRVITQKIAYLINVCGYSPKYITALTFTNKAAKEMLERVANLRDAIDTKGLTITTFHSLGLKILKAEAHHLGYKSNFSILDSYDSAKIINDLAESTDKVIIRAIQTQISKWKNSRISPDFAIKNAKDDLEEKVALIYRSYQDTIKTYHAVDFDDLINLPIELFSQNMEVLYKWQQKIQYLLIDEYQDTNDCQYELIKMICARHQKFTAVGDDDQSIYAWRGANPENLKQLKLDFKNLNIIPLEQNYRSTTRILSVANNLIQNNPKELIKKLWSEHGGGELIRVVAAKNEELEASMVVRKIMLHQLQYNAKFSDYAILYRSNHQSRILEQFLRENHIPYIISGGQSFFDKAEIKDIIAYLRLLVNDDDDTAFIRAITTPKRGVGPVTLEKLVSYAKSRGISLFAALFEEGFRYQCKDNQLENLFDFGNMINDFQFRMNKTDVADFLTELVAKIGYELYLYDHESSSKAAEKKWNNVLSLINYLGKKHTENGKTISELVQMITLINLLDGSDKKEIDAVNLSTLHAAKGLEYPFVYLIGCEDGILPHQESINSDMIEEERRLMYVGITRAERELTISYCEERRMGGELRKIERSRFITEMGSDNVIDEASRSQTKITNQGELSDRLSQLQKLLNS